MSWIPTPEAGRPRSPSPPWRGRRPSRDAVAQRVALLILGLCEVVLIGWLGSYLAALRSAELAAAHLAASLTFLVSCLLLPVAYGLVHVHERGLPETRAETVLLVCGWLSGSFASSVVGIFTLFIGHMLAATALTFALPLYLLDRTRLYRSATPARSRA